MSLFDRFTTNSRRGWNGLEPPPISVRTLLDDLRWHHALYRHDGLPPREVVAFLALRVVQRVSYNLGWYHGRVR